MNDVRRRRSIPRRRKILYSLIAAFAAYSVAEVVTSELYLDGILQPESIWFQEDKQSAPTHTFDPIRGYLLTRSPSRMACVASNGTIESMGTVRGNNLGFPDRDDFVNQRPTARHKRLAVFGDSFTAAQFLNQNWPDRVEDLTQESEQPIQLWNFSVDGGGFFNWWSVLTRLIAKEKYELDGVIFAVWEDDLQRGFTIMDDRVTRTTKGGMRSIAVGRMNEVDPSLWPSTRLQAEPHLHDAMNWRVLTSEEFDQLVDQQSGERGRLLELNRDFRPYLLSSCLSGVGKLLGMTDDPQPAKQITDPSQFPPKYQLLLNDVRAFAESRNIPILVVHLPSREGLLKGKDPPAEIPNFAKYLDAKYVDGSLAFENLNDRQIRECWLTHDDHWNQAGSDRFAQFMVDVIAKVIPEVIARN